MTVNLRVRASGALLGADPILLTSWWRPGTGGGSTADATDAVARFRAMLDAIKSTFTTNLTYTVDNVCAAIEDTTDTLVGSFTGTAVAIVTGTDGGTPLSANNAYLVKLKTNLVVNKRILKGRWFLAGPTETTNGGTGTPSAAQLTTIQNAITSMLTGGATASFPVIVHRPTSSPVVTAGTSGAITTVAPESRSFGSQRNRRAGL